MPFVVGKWNIRDDGVMEMKNTVFPDWEGVSDYIRTFQNNVNSGCVIINYNDEEKGMYVVGDVRQVPSSKLVPSWTDVKCRISDHTLGPYSSDEEAEDLSLKIGDYKEGVKTVCTSNLGRQMYWFAFKL